MNKRRFVLLDRDGTLIVERNYLSDPAEVQLLPGAASGLRKMSELGLGLAVITNQSAIGRGFIDELRLKQIHNRMCELLQQENISLDGIYFCPHLPEDNCDCRKPNVALPNIAASELGFNVRDSFVIGDKECDIDMGRRLGATTFLVLTGYGKKTDANRAARPDYVAADLDQAAIMIDRLLQNKRSP
ncbi:D-glycero-alpha-D-manno-heptose-1,7-bisphosphate 7-phosphatase [Methylobacter luteus]|uniref:D-glycero-alpha-D-manno-heptose-1,7-bisphosphate 7-phosphatase n=1 Tax=Methylobacter luteus TaxID=415 RepID=UPI0004869740|nr:HAD family hydrolase [Methylobacter luteus]